MLCLACVFMSYFKQQNKVHENRSHFGIAHSNTGSHFTIQKRITIKTKNETFT